jgi:uncharacterized protein (DUF2235 family)
MGKNIVVCCDGTGNQVEGNLSNVLKLFRIAQKTDAQRIYYHPGVGTIGTDDAWSRLRQNAKGVFGLATGAGLDDDICNAYRFLATHYEAGDDIYLFGFSRGAYTVRALAGFVYMVGLLPPDQINIADFALTSYKQSSEKNDLHLAWDFSRITGARRATIKFVGVWDTVASMIAPRWDRLNPFPTLQTLPYTYRNPCVQIFRHAMAIDERRRFFRLNRWKEPQPFVADPFDKTAPHVEQDIKQVWFCGVHCDVGGGYAETESAASKFPLAWMIDEAAAHGLQIDAAMRDHLVFGKPYLGSRQQYVAPDAGADLHDSMTLAWKAIEWIPKRTKYQDWKWRLKFDGFYIPDCEPRTIAVDGAPKPRIHESVLARMDLKKDYRPVNFPPDHQVETWPYPPTAPGNTGSSPA